MTVNELNCSCFCHTINILLTELRRSVWKNLDLGRVYRPHYVRSVLTTSVKILPYRPPARLIRAKYKAVVKLLPSLNCSLHWARYFLALCQSLNTRKKFRGLDENAKTEEYNIGKRRVSPDSHLLAFRPCWLFFSRLSLA